MAGEEAGKLHTGTRNLESQLVFTVWFNRIALQWRSRPTVSISVLYRKRVDSVKVIVDWLAG